MNPITIPIIMNGVPITCPSDFSDLDISEHQFKIGSKDATFVCTNNTGNKLEQSGEALIWVPIGLLILNYLWEEFRRQIIPKIWCFCECFSGLKKKIFNKCSCCFSRFLLKLLPPQLLITKQWFFLIFAFFAAQLITTLPNTKQYKDVAGFANSFVAMIGITLGIILNSSLQKHEDAIRLFEMYTGDIIALAMELTAFIENAGEGTNVNQTLNWNEVDMPANNSRLAENQENLAKQIVAILKRATSGVTWKSVVENEDTLQNEYPIFYTESKRFPLVNWHIWGTAYKHIKGWFPSLTWPGRNPTMAQILGFLETKLATTVSFRNITQTPLKGTRDYFLVSLERIFQTLYVLPQVAKHEFRDSPYPAVQFSVDKLKTLDIDYCKYAANNNRQEVDFKKSRLQIPLQTFGHELASTAGLTPTQIFLYTLLDYINEFHRSVGMESQTRKTLTTAWRRLYGTYGDMSTVKTYNLPRIITMTMELTLIGSCFLLLLTSLRGFVDTCSGKNCKTMTDYVIPFICVAMQFLLTGLYIAAQQVRNPFVSTQESLGFSNVTKTAKSTQIGIYQIWINRGLVQMIFPDKLHFGSCKRTTPIEVEEVVDLTDGYGSKEPNAVASKTDVETFLPTRRFDNRLYHGIRF